MFYHTTESREERSRWGFIFTVIWGGTKKNFSRSPTRLALHFIGQKKVTQLSLVAKEANYSLSSFKNWLGNLLMGQ